MGGVAGGWSLREIRDYLAKSDGRRMTTSRLQQISDRAMQKVREGILADPVLRQVLIEEGFDITSTNGDAAEASQPEERTRP